jgi:hypothetical protein
MIRLLLLFVQIRVVVLAVLGKVLEHLLFLLLQNICFLVEHVRKKVLDLQPMSEAQQHDRPQ